MSANGIAHLATKELRQKAKLEQAQLDRIAAGKTRAYYDITQLPTQYDDNNIVDNPNVGGLVVGRPWISQSYSIGTIPSSINEGSAGTINVSTVGVADGTTLYWTIQTHAEDFTTTSGSFTITSNAGSFTVTPTADATTEGLETFTVAIRTGSTSGTIVATTSTIDINDTSLSYSAGLFRSQYSGWPNQNTANPTWFDGKTPVATTTSTDFSLTLTAAETSRAYQWLGYIKPDYTGTWTFTTSGVSIDDCLTIWIGSSALSGYTTGNAVANISITSGSGTISLTSGTYYPIRVQYANNGGPGTNHLRWGRNGSTPSTDFSGLVYYNSATNGF